MIDILTCVAEFLGYKCLAKLRSVSMEANRTLTKDFLIKSHPHALAYIGQQITAKRIDSPSHPFTMHTRGGKMLHFLHNSSFTLFDIHVADNTVSINTVYTHIANGRCFVLGSIRAVLTPSYTNPMSGGSVKITRNDEPTVRMDYVDFLHAIDWCPLRMPALT